VTEQKLSIYDLENRTIILIPLSRFLQQTPGFFFSPRPRECLPVGFPANIPGTCHFLLGYRHPELPAECESLSEHVEAGLRDFGIFSSQQQP
jgi:guanylate cyclase soluble subunit alpha